RKSRALATAILNRRDGASRLYGSRRNDPRQLGLGIEPIGVLIGLKEIENLLRETLDRLRSRTIRTEGARSPRQVVQNGQGQDHVRGVRIAPSSADSERSVHD